MKSSLQKAFENGIDHPRRITKEQIQKVAEKLCQWKFGGNLKSNRDWIKEHPENELRDAKDTIKLVLNSLKIKHNEIRNKS